MSTASRFTPEKRERWLTLIEVGWPVERACAAAGVSRQTVSVWLARGRVGRDAPAVEFARRHDELRAREVAAGPGEASAHGLSEQRMAALNPFAAFDAGDYERALVLAELDREGFPPSRRAKEATRRLARRRAQGNGQPA